MSYVIIYHNYVNFVYTMHSVSEYIKFSHYEGAIFNISHVTLLIKCRLKIGSIPKIVMTFIRCVADRVFSVDQSVRYVHLNTRVDRGYILRQCGLIGIAFRFSIGPCS